MMRKRALKLGITMRWSDIPADEYAALMMLEEEAEIRQRELDAQPPTE